MKTILSLATIAALSTALMAGPAVEVVTPVPALNGFYVGGAYSYLDSEITLVNSDLDIESEITNNAGMILAGYNFNEYIAVEGRYTFMASGDATVAGYKVADVDGDTWAIYAKPQYNVTPEFKVYGLLGYASTSMTDDAGVTADVDGLSYGLGGAYAVTRNVEIFADWTKLNDDEYTVDGASYGRNLNTDAYSIGVNYKF